MHQVPLPPLYVFIRNLLYSPAYNPSIVAWVDQSVGCFKVYFKSSFEKVLKHERIYTGTNETNCDTKQITSLF